MRARSLYQRLLAVVLLTALPVVAVHVTVQLRGELRVAGERAEGSSQGLAAAAIPLFRNLLIVGDLATAQETLDSIMRHGQFRTLSLVDGRSGRLLATGHGNGEPASGSVPRWFAEGLDFHFPVRRFEIAAGGLTYATLLVEPSASLLVADLWQRLCFALLLWLATAGGLLLVLRLSLRRGLRPLAALAAAADRLGAGDLASRAPSCDVPELAATAAAFNRMADNLAEAQETLELRVRERTAELAAREAHTSAILRNLHDGVVELDTAGRIRMANAAACRLFGYPEDELAGRDLKALIPGVAEPAWLAGAPAPGRWRGALRGQRQDGAEFDVELSLDRLALETGSAWIGVLRDISRQKAVEAAREQARLNAERLAMAKSEFLANMSHEIRTPLSAMLGLAQVGIRKQRDAEVRELLGRILQSGELLLRVINDILDFSKMEAGKLRVEAIPFNPSQVIDHAVDLIAPKAYGKGLEFLVEEATGLPSECLGDPVRISQILLNLLGNAVKFTEAGHVGLQVRRHRDEIRFRIVDTGIGMTPAVLERLFEPFEQADASVSRRYGGSGLGLAISRRLAELMGGEIRVASQAGQGSSVQLRLPLKATLPVVEEGPPVQGPVVLMGLSLAEEAMLRATLRCRGLQVSLVHDVLPTAGAEGGLVIVDAAQAAGRADDLRALARRSVSLVVVHTPGIETTLPKDLAGLARRVDRPLRWRHLLQAREPRQGQPVPLGAASGRRLEGIRILAAEDDAANRLVLREILEMEGACVDTAEHGGAACERLAAAGPGAYDLVITDLQMPGLDGYATAERIASLEPGLPVVGLSAHAMADERRRCLAVGMADLIAKPMAIEPLVETLARCRAESLAVAPPAAEAGPVDWRALEARFAGNAAVLPKLVAAFLASAEELAAELHEATEGGATAAVASLAHRSAGLGANLMAPELARVARQAELAARADLPEATTLARQVLALLEQASTAMRARI